MLDINITLFIQLINFIITLLVLDFLLIKPIRTIIKKRRELAGGMLGDAEAFTAQAAEKLENYEAALAKAREEAAASREARKNEALAEEAVVLDAARKKAQEHLLAAREDTKNAVGTAMTEMEKRVPALTRAVVDRLLGKTGRTSEA